MGSKIGDDVEGEDEDFANFANFVHHYWLGVIIAHGDFTALLLCAVVKLCSDCDDRPLFQRSFQLKRQTIQSLYCLCRRRRIELSISWFGEDSTHHFMGVFVADFVRPLAICVLRSKFFVHLSFGGKFGRDVAVHLA